MSRPLARPTGFPVLVAAPPIATNRTDCVDGELVWLPPVCVNDGSGCDCWSEFVGSASSGRTTMARVQTMRGIERRAVLRTLRDAATPLVGPVLAAKVAIRTLEVAAAFPPGTFLSRDNDRIRAAFCLEHQHRCAGEVDRRGRNGGPR